MLAATVTGMLLPFIGTAAGSGAVFVMEMDGRAGFADCLAGFAGGVMLAASVWSLLIPSFEYSASLGRLAFAPSVAGFLLGIVFMLICEGLIDKLSFGGGVNFTKSSLVTAFAVTVHNIPEGMAVGMVYAALLSGSDSKALVGALSLSIGIALQNIPEGMVIVGPMLAAGVSPRRTFLCALFTGLIEVVGTFIGYYSITITSVILPFALAFAGGTMLYVISDEMIPETHAHGSERGATYALLAGFCVMLITDTVFG